VHGKRSCFLPKWCPPLSPKAGGSATFARTVPLAEVASTTTAGSTYLGAAWPLALILPPRPSSVNPKAAKRPLGCLLRDLRRQSEWGSLRSYKPCQSLNEHSLFLLSSLATTGVRSPLDRYDLVRLEPKRIGTTL
jgi:hypothetical protein